MPKVIYLKDYKAPDFLIVHVDLTVELDETNTLVSSQLLIQANPDAVEPSSTLVLDGEGLDLHSVKVNGLLLEKNQYQLTEKELIIPNVPEPCVIEICNSINPAKNTELKGLYLSQGNFITHCEAEGFRCITYFIDRPDVMAIYKTTIIADKTKYPFLLSNGNKVDEGKTPDGRDFITWSDPFKKPSYLFALVAGDYDCVTDKYFTMSGREIQIEFYVEKGQASKSHHAIASLKNAMQWDEETYGRECDLDCYKVVATPYFNMGAMENKGLNIFNSKALLAHPSTVSDERFIAIDSTVAHEYFHNWTGNRVTVKNWPQLSLKEGLTSFRNQTYLEDFCTKSVRANDVNYLRNRQFSEDAGPLAHPVQPKSYIDPDNFYTPTVYRKGAEVFRMLQTLLGSETFRLGMDLYFERHDGQAVTIEQYLAAMQNASGVDLTQFALWFHQAGTPEIDIEEEYNPSEQVYILRIKQITKPTPGQDQKSPLVIPIRMGLMDSNGEALPLYLDEAQTPNMEEVLVLNQSEQQFTFRNMPSKPIASLFRNFSAPVKVRFPIPEAEYPIRIVYDSDAFNRLEACQNYIMSQLLEIIRQCREEDCLTLSDQFISTIEAVLNSGIKDAWLLSEMLTIPSERQIADKMDKVDVKDIHMARSYFITQIATRLSASLLANYESYSAKLPTSGNNFNIKDAGIRRVRNQCLFFLMHNGEPHSQELAMQQFKRELPLNMTNAMAVLKGWRTLSAEHQREVSDMSYQQWRNNTLAIDNWFSVRALNATSIAEIQDLMRVPEFDIKQPNKVSAVFGFLAENMQLLHGHEPLGAVYEFLAQMVVQLDGINPKEACDQVLLLSDWRKYDKQRQKLMTEALAFISKQSISPRLSEIVSKSLQGAPQFAESTVRFFSIPKETESSPEIETPTPQS